MYLYISLSSTKDRSVNNYIEIKQYAKQYRLIELESDADYSISECFDMVTQCIYIYIYI